MAQEDSPRHPSPPSAPASNPLDGQRIALLLLKDGLQGLLKAATKAALLLLRACTKALNLLWSRRGPLLSAALHAPRMLMQLLSSLLATRLGKAVAAAAASILCVHVELRPGARLAGMQRPPEGDRQAPVLNTTLEANVSLFFGAFKCEGGREGERMLLLEAER